MLHLTKTAVQCGHVQELEQRNEGRLGSYLGVPAVPIYTRYRPTRHAELVGGSLYWIVAHQLRVRQEILGFEEAQTEKGQQWRIWLGAEMIPVAARRKRAHQGWRYLEDRVKPADMVGGSGDISALPPALVRELAELCLI
ncbi:hypothetical protein B5C34_10400 [Pacificimonas flava]|uniref:DUF1489 family protein n=2 Tax=Pacificimonas TaxID=1960290 RepID=A0A219B7T7_9SPHN|nr:MULTISPECIES: DUF1489 family protein [Pacificimonas]MBZ6378921.1 DUF1489 family protein [Pacificimonas aurantium]OWV33828.1 hypothetical protein B5C34_10400 [Pacificimonas flava]